MKNKKIYLILIMMALFAMMLFINPTEVRAATDLTITKITEIQRWTENIELTYEKNENWTGDWYTKTAFLTTDSTPNGDSTSIYNVSGSGSIFLSSSSYNGQTLYLVEKYVVNDAVDGVNLPSGDYIYISNIDNETIVNNSITSYIQNENDTYEVYNNGARYTSSEPTTEGRETTQGGYAKKAGTDAKVTSIDRGSIILPIFNLKINMTASGNMMPAGRFCIDDYIMKSDYQYQQATSGLGSASGYYVSNQYYSVISYNYFDSPVSGVRYIWDDSEPLYKECNGTEANGDMYYNISEYTVSEILEDEGTNTYYREVSANLEWNEPVSNGIFYNILPFVLAGIVATTGIVLLKKNSIK